jgi:dihydrolipoamide dehydrogenase
VLGAGGYTADHIVIATGVRPRILLGLEPPKRMPESLLVVGSGAIGIEFGSFYSGLGSKVTVVKVLLRILPAEDEEITRFARTRFEKQGIAIRTRATVTSAKRAPNGVHRSRHGEMAAKVERTSAQPPTGPARRHRRPAAHQQENGALRAGRMARSAPRRLARA